MKSLSGDQSNRRVGPIGRPSGTFQDVAEPIYGMVVNRCRGVWWIGDEVEPGQAVAACAIAAPRAAFEYALPPIPHVPSTV